MTRRLRFTKMQGLGNDFVVLDGVREAIELAPAQLRLLADRHFGVGCDQILTIEPARSSQAVLCDGSALPVRKRAFSRHSAYSSAAPE